MKKILWISLGLLAAANVAAQTGEVRKPGLWEVVMRSSVGTVVRPITVTQCSSADREPDIVLSVAPGQTVCDSTRTTKTKDGYKIVTVCKVHDAGQTTTMDIKTISADQYSGKFAIKFDNPKRAQNQSMMLDVFDAKWLGPCPEGWRAGDMRLSNGIKVNVLDDKAKAVAAAKKDADHDHDHSAPGHKH